MESHRVQLIKRRYGSDFFVKAGRKGGNPVLLGIRDHKLKVVRVK